MESFSEVTGGQTGLKEVHYSTEATTHTAVHVASYANARDFRCTVHVENAEDQSVGIIPNLKCE